MRLAQLVDGSNAVAATRSRLEKIAILAQLLRNAALAEIPIVVSYLSGALPQGRVGVGWSVVRQMRDVAAADEPHLEVADVDEAFGRIAESRGPGSQVRRTDELARLFGRATPVEQDFLVRLISGELRQGALEGVLAEAVAAAAGTTGQVVRQAAMTVGDLREVARTALSEGPAALSRYAIQLFRPIQPMLASPADTVGDALAAIGEAAFEVKLDGARIQVHKSSGDVRVFSRALRDVTPAVPEVVEAVRELPVREAILDGEVLALQPSGFPFPFQETMTRFGRKIDIERMRQTLPLTPRFFDCLFVDGRPLTSEPLRDRCRLLRSFASHLSVPQIVTADERAAAAFFDEAIALGHEGVMAKALDSPYAAGTRGSAWLKIKRVRTLDLVVLAAEWGSGRRRGWLSNLHLGARDAERGGFVMLGKTFKGMTDDLLAWQTTALLERETHREGHIVFVRPELVVEIAFNDLQESPQYPGGLALRFARVKAYRPDKTAADADTIEALRDLYRSQTGRQPARGRT